MRADTRQDKNYYTNGESIKALFAQQFQVYTTVLFAMLHIKSPKTYSSYN